MATTPMDQPHEAATTESASQVSSIITDALRGVWWAALGLVAVTGEGTGRLVGTLVRKGKEVEPAVLERTKRAADTVDEVVEDVGTRVKGFAGKVGRGAEAAEAAMDEKVGAALKKMGFPTKEEVQELAAKLDALTTRLEEMQAGKRPGKKHEGD